MTPQVDHARDQAKAQLQSITEMVQALHFAAKQYADFGYDMYAPYEKALESIREDPLSVQVRSDWYDPGSEDRSPAEYNILLCTGGPAVRIIGTLSEYLEPDSAHVQYQDWGTPWTDYPLTSELEAIVLEYAQQFYYGE